MGARAGDALADFQKAFEELSGNRPFPWQERLFAKLVGGEPPAALDLPTGLGKTSVMAIWLLARAFAGASVRKGIPRRLVYVVDRRAVVDQATEEAERLRRRLEESPPLKARLGLGKEQPLPISTLRGKHVDNQQWRESPALPAIIVGTVDMIGSRLLFSGYGVSPRMRPYHAGLIGADTLVVLDEAHLVPPFEALLETIATGGKAFGPSEEAIPNLVPPFRLLSLSATGRERSEGAFRLGGDDFRHPVVGERLHAEKRLTLCVVEEAKALVEELRARAWRLATEPRPARVLVFCHKREDALKVKEAIDKTAKDKKIEAPSELLVGERRVHEREQLFTWLQTHGFIAGERSDPQVPTFLIATSAGEVGVDLDADHMVCDLVEWERMVQRLGRVNRRGGAVRSASVEVVAAPPKDKKKDAEQWEARLARLRGPLDLLPDGDASPGAIDRLKQNAAAAQAMEAAQTPVPLHPALTRPLVDAWSMTSLDEHTGRPEIPPWLRGWEVEKERHTVVVWRRHLPVRNNSNGRAIPVSKKEIDAFLDAAAPHLSESLEADTDRVADWLLKRVRAVLKGLEPGDGIAKRSALLVLNAKDELDDGKTGSGGQWSLDELAALDGKGKDRGKDQSKRRQAFIDGLVGRTLMVDARLGGLNEDGMLAGDEDGEPSTIDGDEAWTEAPFRVRESDDQAPTDEPGWRQTRRFAVETDADGEGMRWIVVDERQTEAGSETSRAVSRRPQTLRAHTAAVKASVCDLGRTLGLADAYIDMLAVAARLHDEGKRAACWQRAFNAPSDDIYAKTRGPVSLKLLDGYRHELGSLEHLARDAAFKALPPELQELALHLVAAHHGNARPLISTRGCQDAPPSVLHERAREVALRFARLQRRWGPWGLAWWEALLRAADQQASRANDADARRDSAAPRREAGALAPAGE